MIKVLDDKSIEILESDNNIYWCLTIYKVLHIFLHKINFYKKNIHEAIVK